MTTSSGLFLFDQAADLVHIVLRCKIDVLLRHFQPCSTQFDLTDRFLTRDIQNRMLVGDGTAELQKHRRFANTRFAAEQNHAAQHDAAAQHPVKLRYAGQDAGFFSFRSADIGQPPGCQRSQHPPAGQVLPLCCWKAPPWELPQQHPHSWYSSFRSWGSGPSSAGWFRRSWSRRKQF